MRIDTDWARLFGLAPGHRLDARSESTSMRCGARHITHWFDEYDADAQLVARYRGWFNDGLEAPWRQQLGWERYAPDGTLEVREVRYTTREAADRVH